MRPRGSAARPAQAPCALAGTTTCEDDRKEWLGGPVAGMVAISRASRPMRSYVVLHLNAGAETRGWVLQARRRGARTLQGMPKRIEQFLWHVCSERSKRKRRHTGRARGRVKASPRAAVRPAAWRACLHVYHGKRGRWPAHGEGAPCPLHACRRASSVMRHSPYTLWWPLAVFLFAHLAPSSAVAMVPGLGGASLTTLTEMARRSSAGVVVTVTTAASAPLAV